MTLADGRTLSSKEINGILNRLVAPPTAHLLPIVVPGDLSLQRTS